MKKLLAIMLTLCLVLSLGACAEPEAEETEPVTVSPLETVAEAPAPAAPMPEAVTVKFPETSVTGYDETGEIPLITIDTRLPEITVPGDPQVQEAVDAALEAVISQCLSPDPDLGLEAGTAEAKAMREELEDAFQPWYRSLTGEVMRGDRGLISLTFATNNYSSGVHGWYAFFGLVLDLNTGAPLTLDGLSQDPEAFRAGVLDRMVELAETDPGIQEQIAWFGQEEYADRFGELLREGSWYLDREGLVIFSNLEEFGPYAAGSVEFHIPYGDLEGLLKPEYVPEPVTGSGNLSLQAPEGCNARILDDVTDRETGQVVLLSAEGTVSHVGLWHVAYDGTDFIPMDPLWYGSDLQDCVLRIDTMIPDTVPALMVTYETDQGQFARLLTQSGEDGSYFLMEP